MFWIVICIAFVAEFKLEGNPWVLHEVPYQEAEGHDEYDVLDISAPVDNDADIAPVELVVSIINGKACASIKLAEDTIIGEGNATLIEDLQPSVIWMGEISWIEVLLLLIDESSLQQLVAMME